MNIQKIVATLTITLTLVAHGQGAMGDPADVVQISGRMVSSLRVPVPNQVVTFRNLTASLNGTTPESTVETDASGFFTFAAKRGDEYQVFAAIAQNAIATILVARGGDVSLGDVVLEGAVDSKPMVHLAGLVRVKNISSRPGSIGETRDALQSMSVIAVYFVCAPVAGNRCDFNQIHVVLGSGQDVRPAVAKDALGGDKEEGGGQAQISADGRTAGWLASYGNCCTSYPLARRVVVFRPGKPLRSFAGDGRAIFEWHLLAGGSQVALYQHFPHGNSVPHYELRDVDTGRMLGHVDGQITRKAAWLKVFR